MRQPKITQGNVHLANRLLENGRADDMAAAINMVYMSPVYDKLKQEKTKYWWLGINLLYHEIITSI